MEKSPFLPLPDGLVLGQVEISEAQLTVEVISTQPCACCPGCETFSDAVHCQYQRSVHDVPCGGRKVVLRLRVRKFFCRLPTCPRKVFAERLPEFVRPWARVSNRLLEELKAIGLSASAEVSERLAPRLGMKVKAPTLLRYLRTITDAPVTEVTKVGIDDFALKRADSYGTILINLESRRPLDLLPDRTAEAVKPWLRAHPEIQVVSRDRASAFADAVNQVLPHATQIADRYHLVHNLREHLQRLLDHKRSCLPLVEDTPLKSQEACHPAKADPPAGMTPEVVVADSIAGTLSSEQHTGPLCSDADLSCLTYAERKKKISRDKRVARYEEILALHREGFPNVLLLATCTSVAKQSSSSFPHLLSRNVLQELGNAHLGRASSIGTGLTCVNAGKQGCRRDLSFWARLRSVATPALHLSSTSCFSNGEQSCPQTQARKPTQATHLSTAGAASPFFAICFFPHDFVPREAHRQTTATA